MNMLLILNDAHYGCERLYNGLRLAVSLSKREGVTLRVFLLGDAAAGAKAGQQVPSGFYNIERMLKALARERCPGVHCLVNPVPLSTRLEPIRISAP